MREREVERGEGSRDHGGLRADSVAAGAQADTFPYQY
jgi:hypothetical protein